MTGTDPIEHPTQRPDPHDHHPTRAGNPQDQGTSTSRDRISDAAGICVALES